MGSEVCRAVEDASDLELVARFGRGDALDDLVAARTEVAVDFTLPSSVVDHVRFCVEQGVHAVVGTSGLGGRDLEHIDSWARAGRANVFVAPNFSVGAVVMMNLAARAAPHFARAEIVERHHERKVDAPSATALRTAALMSSARAEPWEAAAGDAEASEARGRTVDGVLLHSLRLPGSVAHQEVLLGSAGETLVIRHDAIDRSCYMPGVLLAIRRVADLDGLTVGLEHLLEL